MKCLAVLFALCLSVAPALAAAPAQTPPTPSSAPIRAGDVLDLQIIGEPGLSKSYTVDPSGNISLDYAGQVPAAGRTTDQLAAELRTRLARYVKQPAITVTLNVPVRQEILISGEVSRPGPVRLRPGDALLDVITMVGGLAPTADGTRVALIRRGYPQPQMLNVETLLKGDLSQNVPLNDGDILQVPKKEMGTYQILGEVRQPGTKRLGEATTVLDAIVAAAGLTERADRSQISLMRKGQVEPVSIDLDKVLAGDGDANLALQVGDVLSITPRILFQIVGEVRAPGERALRNGGTLMEAVMLAGGFGPDADRANIQVTHRDGTTETLSLANVNAVVGGAAVKSGDLIIVNRGTPELITLTGAVRSAGQMRYREGMKVTDAILAAGGLLENAKWQEIRVLRGDGPDRKIVVFNLEKYLKAPQGENLALQAGDQIFIEARKARGPGMLQRLLQVLPLANLFFLRY